MLTFRAKQWWKTKGMIRRKVLFLHIITCFTYFQQTIRYHPWYNIIYLSFGWRREANSNLVSNHDSSTNLCTWYCTSVKKNLYELFYRIPRDCIFVTQNGTILMWFFFETTPQLPTLPRSRGCKMHTGVNKTNVIVQQRNTPGSQTD